MAVDGKNSVMVLNEFLMKKLGRPVTKGDVDFTIVKLEDVGGHQCTITMNCLGELQFAGEILPDAKAAKTSAADQVLLHFAEEIIEVTAAGGKKKKGTKRTADAAGLTAAVTPSLGASPDMNNKSELNILYSKLIRRPLTKGEVMYETLPVDVGGFQSQLQLAGLPEPLNQTRWAGEVCAKKQDAEQSVAGVALDTIRSDPTCTSMINAAAVKAATDAARGREKFKGKSKGKGKGKHKGQTSSHMGIDPSTNLLTAAASDGALWNETFAAAMAASGYPAGFSAFQGLV